MVTYLIDTNIWLRTVQRESPHHALAVDALAALLGRGDAVCITAQNVIEFWSVATRPAAANGMGWSVQMVQEEIGQIQAQFPLLDETADVFGHWVSLVTAAQVIGRRVHDARLVAVMLTHGITHLLTFNHHDFRQFPMITVITPGDVLVTNQPPS